jgi:four helix bundle protein
LVYSLTAKIPESEKFGLISQIRRSSVSIPSNIAEGYGRNYKKDYSRFLQIARGSLFECQTQIEIAPRSRTNPFVWFQQIKKIYYFNISRNYYKFPHTSIKKYDINH